MTRVGTMGERHLSSAQAVPTSLPGSRMSLSQSLSSKNLSPSSGYGQQMGNALLSRPHSDADSTSLAAQGTEEQGCPCPCAHGGGGTHRVLSPSRPLNMPLRTDSS